MNLLLILARFTHFASAMILFGVALFGLYGGTVMPRQRRLVPAMATVVLVSALAWLAAVIVNSTGDWADLTDIDTIRATLTEDPFGQLWARRLALAFLLIVLGLVPGLTERRAGRIAFTALSGILLATLAETGHAGAHKGTEGNLHRINQTVHLLAAGAWLGGLWPLATLLGAALSGSEGALARLRMVVPRFSQMAYVAVALILLSGLVNGIFLVGSPAALAATPYGRVLTLKIALFAAVLVLAAVNRLRYAPRLTAGPSGGVPVAPFRRNVLAEQALALGILAAVAYLGTLIPAIYHGE